MKKYNVVITSMDRTKHGWAAIAKLPNSPLNVGWEKDFYKEDPINYIDRTVDSLMENACFSVPSTDYLEISIYDSGSVSLDYLNDIKEKYPQIKIIPSPIPHDGKDLSPTLSLINNTNRALADGAKDAKYVILVQDDVIFAHNAFFAMDEWITSAPENFGFLTFWSQGNYHNSRKRNRKQQSSEYKSITPNSFWGSLCLVFNSKDIDNLLRDPEMHRGRATGHDMAVKAWAHRTNRKVYGHSPPLVDHIGHQSTIASREKRTNRAFPGENYNSFNKSINIQQYTGNINDIITREFLNGSTIKYSNIVRKVISKKEIKDIVCLDINDIVDLVEPKTAQCVICHEFYHFCVLKFGIEKTDKYIKKLLNTCRYLIFDSGGPTEEIGQYRKPWSSILKIHFKNEKELLDHFNTPYEILGTYESKKFTRSVIMFENKDK